jgi:hypothetical protein
VTKPGAKWSGELGREIRLLPASSLMHGGRVTSNKVADYNMRAIESIDRAIHNERLKKLPLLADHYAVGKKNYAGIAMKLAAEFERHFKGDIEDLRKIYDAPINKILAIKMAVKYCKGFDYKRPELKTEAGVIGHDGCDLAVGGILPMLAKGRPEKWSRDRLEALANAVAAKKVAGLTDREILVRLRLKTPWKDYNLENLESRLQEAKSSKNPKNLNRDKVREANDLLDKIRKKQKKRPR